MRKMKSIKTGLDELWVCEYSARQDAYHVHRLGDAIRGNLRLFKEKRCNDYLTMWVCSTQDEAFRFASFLRKKIKDL